MVLNPMEKKTELTKMGLGLKEAKELAQGAPQWIGKELKTEEAKEMIGKLKAIGAECRMV